MSEDRDRLQGQNEESENEDVEAHRLEKNDEPGTETEEVEAHRLQRMDEPTEDARLEKNRLL